MGNVELDPKPQMLTFERANIDTPPATRSVHIYSGKVYLMP